MTVYSNTRYLVRKCDADEFALIDGESTNWEVVNKEHDTVEARLGNLPSAILTADKMDQGLGSIMEDKNKPDLTVVSH